MVPTQDRKHACCTQRRIIHRRCPATRYRIAFAVHALDVGASAVAVRPRPLQAAGARLRLRIEARQGGERQDGIGSIGVCCFAVIL